MIRKDLIHRELDHTDEEYHQTLIQLSAPIEIIPIMFGLRNDWREAILKSYEVIKKKFEV
jgi:hypothetical protein